MRSFLEAQKVEVSTSANSATLESTAIASRGAAVDGEGEVFAGGGWRRDRPGCGGDGQVAAGSVLS